MKKIVIVFSILLLAYPQLSKAVSGACSSHGGVNCSIGSDIDGSVICNDGWKDSSVLFVQSAECQAKICIYPASTGCKTENDYGAMQSSQIRSGSQEFMNVISSGSLKACRDQITQYQSDLTGYNNCINQQTILNNNQETLANLQTDFITSMISLCHDSLGVNSNYDSNQKACVCTKGYAPVLQNTKLKCVLANDYCLRNFGTSSSPIMGKFNSPVTLKEGAVPNERCACNEGFILNLGKCVTNTKATTSIAVTSNNNSISLKKVSINVDKTFSSKLSGKILIQTELHGEAWYVNPKDGKRYYMADGSSAYSIMRRLGIGINNQNYNKILSNKTYAKAQAGKIFIKTEDLGKAYYIDSIGTAYYLRDGAEAYNIMRKLGLGIKNSDLDKIQIGE